MLLAQAMKESSHYEKQTTKRKWWGQKTTVKQTKHTTTNRVTEFTAGGNLNLLSRDDSTYEASKIEAGKNATLTSTNGRVNFLAVKNTTFEQTVSTSKGFYIKQANKGYSEGKWVLPSVYAGGKLTVDAASGISADVKTKNGQALQGAITALGVQPGTEWLKGLNTRNDVQWNVVKDAYDSWNYKSQSLNPAVAAVIAIAAAAVTAGTGLVALAGSGAITATGVTGATASAAVYGSAYAGMTSLISQAAVALVENQGNLSKTLKSFGSSSSVKSLATSMVIGGALAGFDKVMNIDVPPDKAKLPVLAARLVIASCKTNSALCLDQAGIYAADIVAPEAIVGTGAVTTGSTLILGKTEDSVKKLSRQLVNVFDEFYKTKTFNTQPVAGFIKGEIAAGTNTLSTKTADSVKSLQKDNTAKLVNVFNKQNPNAELNVFGKPLQQVLGLGGSDTRGKTKVFSSEELTEDEIISFATSLTGGIPFKEQVLPDGRLMYAKINDNQTINLRNFSSSAEKTGARWTIEIIGNSDIKAVSKTSLNKFEVKFR